MAVIWAPETASDFLRIHEHNEEAFDTETADDIEEFVYRCGNLVRPGQGLRWSGLTIRRVRTIDRQHPKRISYQYKLFFRALGADVEIFAVYHVREEWEVLVPGRVMPAP